MEKRVLIAGASIAGNTAAWWLGHYGFGVVVVEKETAQAPPVDDEKLPAFAGIPQSI